MALKKLFHSKTYNIRDGLDEYDDDYTFFEKLDPLTITSDMKHMIEVEARRALEKEQQEEEKRLLAEALEDNDYTVDNGNDDGIEEEWDDDFADNVEDEIEETSTLIAKSEIEDIKSDNEGVA
jgi:metallophosphoesterase superfamily enzyme